MRRRRQKQVAQLDMGLAAAASAAGWDGLPTVVAPSVVIRAARAGDLVVESQTLVA